MKDNKIFVPLTLDNSTKTMFSGKQLLGFCLFGLMYLIFQLLVIKIKGAFPPTLRGQGFIVFLIEIVGTYFFVFLVRKIVIREDKILKNYQTGQALQKTELDFAWDIFSVKNSHIRYCASGREAVIVQLTHGYLVDRPPDQETVHRQAINNALGILSKQGFSHIYLNREVQDGNLEPLKETQRRMTAYRGSQLYDVGNKIIRHTCAVCSNVANTELEYYVILADTMDTIKRLDIAAQNFMSALQDTAYVHIDILSDEQIWKLICDLYGLKFIDRSRLLNKMFVDNKLEFITLLEVNRTKRDKPTIMEQQQPYVNNIISEEPREQVAQNEEDYL